MHACLHGAWVLGGSGTPAAWECVWSAGRQTGSRLGALTSVEQTDSGQTSLISHTCLPHRNKKKGRKPSWPSLCLTGMRQAGMPHTHTYPKAEKQKTCSAVLCLLRGGRTPALAHASVPSYACLYACLCYHHPLWRVLFLILHPTPSSGDSHGQACLACHPRPSPSLKVFSLHSSPLRLPFAPLPFAHAMPPFPSPLPPPPTTSLPSSYRFVSFDSGGGETPLFHC